MTTQIFKENLKKQNNFSENLKITLKKSESQAGQRFGLVADKLIELEKVENYGDLAERLGLKSQSSISGIKGGLQKPTIEVIGKLRELYNVNTDYIISGSLPMFKKDTPIAESEEYAPKKLGKKRVINEIYREDLEEYLREGTERDNLTLLDEVALKLLGNTLSNAFVNENIETLSQFIAKKIRIVRIYAKEYLIQRVEDFKQIENSGEPEQ